VQVVVEFLPLRVDAAQAVPLEDGEELALGRFDAGEEVARDLVLDPRRIDARERPMQIVGDVQKLAREPGDRVFLAVLGLALGTTARVLRLRDGANPLVAELRGLGLCLCEPLLERRLRARVLVRCTRRDGVVLIQVLSRLA
jgi:hypothetical protein